MREVLVNPLIDNARFNRFFKGVLAICLVTTICDGFSINMFGLVIPSLMKEWHLPPMAAGTLASWGMFGMAFGSLAFGPLADAIGKKKAILIGTLGFVVFTASCGFVNTVSTFAVLRFLAGCCLGSVYPLAVAFTSEYSPKRIRSRVTVWTTSGMAIGTLLAALLGIAVIVPLGWRWMFYVTGVMILLLIAQAFLPESVAFLKKTGQKERIARTLEKMDPSFKATAEDDYKLVATTTGKGNLSNLFKDGYARNTILFWFVMAFSYIFIFGVMMWLPKLMTLKGFSIKFSLFFTLVWNLGFILGIPLFGYAQDKIGGKRTLQIGWVILAILTASIGFMNNYWVLTVLLFLTGACQHGASGVSGSYVAQSYPIHFRASGTTWGFGCGRIGGILGPMIGGYLLSMKLSAGVNLMFYGVVILLGAIVVSFTKDFFHQKPAAQPLQAQVASR
jgi:AAHS family benzoate transporter-like MFS transporter